MLLLGELDCASPAVLGDGTAGGEGEGEGGEAKGEEDDDEEGGGPWMGSMVERRGVKGTTGSWMTGVGCSLRHMHPARRGGKRRRTWREAGKEGEELRGIRFWVTVRKAHRYVYCRIQ